MPRSSIVSAHRTPVSVSFGDWSGGYNSNRKGMGIDANQLSDVLNMRYVNSEGRVGLTQREGLTLLSSGGATGYAIKDVAKYTTSGGTSHTLAVSNSTLYRLNTATMASVGALQGTRGRMLQFANKCIIMDASYLKYWDGTTLNMCYDTGGTMLSSTAGYASSTAVYVGSVTRAGHKFTTPNWGSGFTIPSTQVTFWLSKTGTPPGTLIVRVRKVSDDSIVAASATMTADSLESAGQEETFTLTSSTDLLPNTAYYVLVEYADAGSDGSNNVLVHYTTGTSASGNYATYNSTYSDVAGDCYIKFYPGLPPKSAFGCNYYDRIVINDEDNPKYVRYSQINDPFKWSGTGAGFIAQVEEGYEVRAIRPFRTAAAIHYGGGMQAIYLLTGTDPSSSYTMTRVAVGASAANQDCCYELYNDQLFLDESGLMSLYAVNAYGDAKKAGRSSNVENLLLPALATPSSRFGMVCQGHLQMWIDIGSAYQLVYEAPRGIWTKYQFELGTGVTMTAGSDCEGTTIIGDSAGHLWKYDLNTVVYTDNNVEYTSNTYFRTRLESFGTELVKRLRFIAVQARSLLGGTFDIKVYKDMSYDAAQTISVVMGADGDLTVDEATMTVDDAIYTVDASGSTLKLHRAPHNSQLYMIGIENIDPNGTAMLFDSIRLEAAISARYWQ